MSGHNHTKSNMNANSTDLLGSVRRRGIFLLGALLCAGAAAEGVILISYLLVAVHFALEIAERFRQILGLPTQGSGPDWYQLSVFTAIILIPVMVIVGLRQWYRRIWRRRLKEVWEHKGNQKKHSHALPMKRIGHSPSNSRVEYLRALLQTPAWAGEWPALQQLAGVKDISPTTVEQEYFPQIAEAMLKRLEEEIAERAIAAGLIVGIEQHRVFDTLTIIAASLELQLHVLTRLGKEPSLKTWLELFRRTGASLFINTYLNREDTLAVSFAVKKAAMGVATLSEFVDEVGDSIGEIDFDEAVDAIVEVFGVGGGGLAQSFFSGTLNLTAVSAGVGMGVGAVGLKHIAEIIEKVGDDLLQGVLAGAAIYYHGIAIAAENLAVNNAHRESEAMNRSFSDGVRKISATAGSMLREQVRGMRMAYGERRKRAFTTFKDKLLKK